MDATLTEILQREGLHKEALQPLHGGQTNDVYLVGGDLVLRVGRQSDDARRLLDEAALLGSLAGVAPVPRVLASGTVGGAAYQLQERVHGTPLHHLWAGLAARERRRIVEDLVTALRAIHARRVPGWGPFCGGDRDPATSWPEWCARAFDENLSALQALGVPLPAQVIDILRSRFAALEPALQGVSEPCLVHGDLWAGNLLVRDGRLTAILDWELAMGAPAEYECLLLEQFCLYPNDFAEAEHEVHSVGDWASLALLVAEAYPELVQASGARERLDAYHLIYSLEAYRAWVNGQPREVRERPPVALLAKALHFCSRHGPRLLATRA